ncbi:MAG: hypothetical protein KF809_00170 [Chloroflexi bacterium]|nr:hypothetical protein [Chloroflexota bacterium]
MAILASLFTMLGRFAGRVVNALLGWATILLFGRVDPRRQAILGLVAVGSLVWVAAIVGAVVPDVGTLLVAAIPRPGWVEEAWVRWGMLGVVLLLPLLVGAVGVWAMRADARPSGGALVVAVLRGYPFTALLALTIAFLAVVALVRRLRALSKRWEDTHLPVIVQPDGYEAVVRTLRTTLSDAGLDTLVRPAPCLVSAPPRLLDRVAGQALGSLVPDQLVLLVRADLEILVYPSDLAMSGARVTVARARAAAATGLVGAPAWLTVSADAQAIEDDIIRASRMDPAETGPLLARVDRRLATSVLGFDDWETLRRMRLQLQVAGADGGMGGVPEAIDAELPWDDSRPEAPARGRRLLDWAGALGIAALLLLDILSLVIRPGRDGSRRR